MLVELKIGVVGGTTSNKNSTGDCYRSSAIDSSESVSAASRDCDCAPHVGHDASAGSLMPTNISVA